ncbi:MAG TPA: DUF4145 domain-containing protein [Caulobacteraceae bacterium]|nr:DUF4145 domain-containing protein [Caulobacteraceae bacterium]
MERARVEYYPESGSKIYQDSSLPEKIREAFVYIQEDAQRKRNPAGILSGSRACLDVALKHFGESTGGRRTRIQALADRKIITQGIADWAQTLWEEGSDAVHDLDANIERAIEHVAFLRLFFEVSFSLPAKIAAASHGVVDSAVEQESDAQATADV